MILESARSSTSSCCGSGKISEQRRRKKSTRRRTSSCWRSLTAFEKRESIIIQKGRTTARRSPQKHAQPPTRLVFEKIAFVVPILANSEEKRERKMCLEKKCPFLLWFMNKKTTDTERERERERERETRETRTRFKYYCDVVIDDEDDDDDADTNIIHSAKENNDGGKFRAQNARKRRRERRTQNDVLFVF